MAVPTVITDVSTTANSNSPAGSDSIGNPGQIDDYFRGYGAVFRAETLNKSWERWNDTPTYIGVTQFSVTGDKTSRYVVGRKVKATVTAGTVYGYISASVFGAVTTVTLAMDGGALDSGLSEVQLGPETFALPKFSANLAALIGDETGSGSLVFGTSPTINTPTMSGLSVFNGATIASTPQAKYTLASTQTTIGSDFAFIELQNSSNTNNCYSGIGWSNTTAGNYGAGIYGVHTTAGANPQTAVVVATYNGTAYAERLRVTSDGRLYGTALHNNAGAVTGTTNQYIASGTYTPTVTNVSNTSSRSDNGAIQWMRVGNVVSVSGSILAAPASSGFATEVTVTLPIAAAHAGGTPNQIGGVGCYNGSTYVPVSITSGGAGTNKADFLWTPSDTGSHIIQFSFMYVVN